MRALTNALDALSVYPAAQFERSSEASVLSSHELLRCPQAKRRTPLLSSLVTSCLPANPRLRLLGVSTLKARAHRGSEEQSG